MQDFKKLRVWHAARSLASAVVDALPERSGRKIPRMRSQAIAAATSVEWNIAEGCGRSGRGELLQFLDFSLSSLSELEAQLSFARDKRVLREAVYAALDQQVTVVRRMLIAFIRTLQRSIAADENDRRKKRDASR